MATILAVDYGRKNIGMAIAHQEYQLIQPLPVLQYHHSNFWQKITNTIQHRNVCTIVLGMPSCRIPTKIQSEIIDFQKALAKKFPSVTIVLQDESYSSVDAENIYHALPGKKKTITSKNRLDSLAASIILRAYFMQPKSNIII